MQVPLSLWQLHSSVSRSPRRLSGPQDEAASTNKTIDYKTTLTLEFVVSLNQSIWLMEGFHIVEIYQDLC